MNSPYFMRVPGRALLPVITCTLAMAPAARAQFQDRTVENGLIWRGATWGAAFADVDGDGDLDLYAAHHTVLPTLFWNQGSGEFLSTTHPQPWAGPTDRHGAVLVSFDLDNDLEIFVAHGADGGAGAEPNELYRNDGGGSLRYLLGSGGASDPSGRPRSTSAADIDRDGRPDIFTGEAPDAVSRNSLFRNNGNLFFTDIAAAVGLDESLGTIGGIFGDMDDDGDPDLLVGGEEFTRPTKLFRNDGGVFVDDTARLVPAPGVISGADWGDFDNDGDLDLAVTEGNVGVFDTYAEGDSLVYYFNTRYADSGLDGMTVPSLSDTTWAQFRILAHYDTSRIFLGPDGVHPPSAVAAFPLTNAYVGAPRFTPGVDRGTYVWRSAPNGKWEIRCSTPNVNYDTFDGFMTSTLPHTGVTPIQLENPNFPPGRPRVWRNDGAAFHEVTGALGLTAMVNPRDVSWVDYDNDGDLDLHIVDMGNSGVHNAPDRMYRNDGPGLPMADVTAAEGLQGGTVGLGDGGIWGDIDGDLDLDLFLQEGAGPATFFSSDASRLLVNKGERGNALLIDCQGMASGPSAIGTKVTVVAGALRVCRRVQANAWRGFQDPLTVHAGIGAAAVADSVIVEWPAGTVQVFLELAPGHYAFQEESTASPVVAPPGTPRAWMLLGAAPQPAPGVQRIRLRLQSPASLQVTVQDVAGRIVRRLHDGPLAAGDAGLVWDGAADDGRRVASGVYWVRVTDGRDEATAKLVRIR